MWGFPSRTSMSSANDFDCCAWKIGGTSPEAGRSNKCKIRVEKDHIRVRKTVGGSNAQWFSTFQLRNVSKQNERICGCDSLSVLSVTGSIPLLSIPWANVQLYTSIRS